MLITSLILSDVYLDTWIKKYNIALENYFIKVNIYKINSNVNIFSLNSTLEILIVLWKIYQQ